MRIRSSGRRSTAISAVENVTVSRGDPGSEAPHPDGGAGSTTPWWRPSLPGSAGAVLLACLSFTPSLLPRSGLTQGVVCGISAAIGYGLGVVAAWAWRAVVDRGPRPPGRRSWRIFAVVAVVALVGAMLLGRYWQGRMRDLMDMPPDGLASVLVIPLAAVIVFVVLLGVSRGLRWLYHRLADLLSRWIGPRAARALGWLVVVAGTVLIVSGVLLDGFVSLTDEAFSVRNRGTDEGVTRPIGPERSGSPQSLIPWESLGRQGRNFIGRGPTTEQISGFSGTPAPQPIRVYAGLESADTSEARAELAVEDLVRAGGFERGTLVVITTTGSGWVDPSAIDSFEYITGGNSAAVSMQYSYLPSWISYLVDQDRAREAGRDLFDAVYGRWADLPPDHRPRLVIAGESLGSFGGETAFSGEHDLGNRTYGAVFAGPPNFNELYREFVDGRDPGSTEVSPVYRAGRTVRFSDDPGTDVPPAGAPWTDGKVLYVQHPSDPIVWWSPQLILQQPDWLTEAANTDVLDTMVWIPFVTFWQVTADLPFATEVPAGHGHVYTDEYVDAWAVVLAPPSWSEEKAARLRALV